MTVTAAEDADAADDTATLTHSARAAPNYGSVSNASLTVTVTDNDTPAWRVSVTSLTVDGGRHDREHLHRRSWMPSPRPP